VLNVEDKRSDALKTRFSRHSAAVWNEDWRGRGYAFFALALNNTLTVTLGPYKRA